LVRFECKVSKVHLGADQNLLRIFQLFLGFILFPRAISIY
jgi:hypothetical protein